jgi:hypothetical protein
MGSYDIVWKGREEVQIKAWSRTFKQYRPGDMVPALKRYRNYSIAAGLGDLLYQVTHDDRDVGLFSRGLDALQPLRALDSYLDYHVFNVFPVVRNRRLVSVEEHWKEAAAPIFSKFGDLLDVTALNESSRPSPYLYFARYRTPTQCHSFAAVADSAPDALGWIRDSITQIIQGRVTGPRRPGQVGQPPRFPGSPVDNEIGAPGQGSGWESRTAELYDVALNFAGEDREYVERVAGLLKQRGVRVFYDRFERATLWGTDLIDHLAEVYRTWSRYVVMFISQHYVAKAWPTHERAHAQARALLSKKQYILPARFDDTPVPGLAPSIGYIDLRGLEPDELVDLIVEKLKSRTNA